MSETDLTAGTPKQHGAFSSDEEQFFQKGEALESGLISLDELGDRRPRPTSWGPRIALVGCVCVALLALSLVGGKDPPTAAVAAVTFVPAAESAPLPAPPPAPTPAPPAPAPIAAAAPTSAPTTRAIEKRPAKKKAWRGKHAHRQRAGGRR